MKRAQHRIVPWCLAFFLGTGYGQKKPDVNVILSGFIEKAETDFAYALDNYTHEEFETVRRFKSGVVVEIEESLFLVKKIGPLPARKLLSKNGVAVLDSEFQPKKESVAINRRLFNKYNFEFGRSETLDGERCWILSFKPKGGLPEEDKKDKILNNLAGELVVNQETLACKKIALHLTREIDYYSPDIFGLRAKKMNMVILAKNIGDYAAISRVDVEFQYAARALFWPINRHESISIEYKNYERREP